MKPILQKGYARDFSLPLIEAWAKGETTDPRQWTHLMNPVRPYEVFIRANGLVDCYVDQKGIDWIKAEMEKHLDEKGYIELIVGTYYERVQKIRDSYEKKKTLNREALIEFLRNLENAWAWHEANWFLMEILHDKKHPKFKLPDRARVELQPMVPNSDMVIRKSLKKLFPQFKEYSSELLIEEIVSGTLPSLSVLKERHRKYVFANATLFTGMDLVAAEKKFSVVFENSTEETKAISEFKGQVAYPGVVEGLVRKIMSRADIPKLKKGEILVSPMTMPEYVPAMKKAKAIVTDEGGITCHAAIVARELKTPCIIGTKIATSVLKDGDRIRVDAQTGTITILK